ncbi:MAG: hypothetical protein WCF36_04040 [Candidatus Nanopelagicales bacterium]
MRTARTITATLAGLGLVLSLTACSSDDTAETNAQYCTSSAAAQAEVAELRTLVTGGEATIDDVKAQVQAIGTATATAAQDAADLADAVKADIKAADDAFDDAIAAIPGDATLSEAAAAYQAAIDAWDAAMASIRTNAGC